MILQQVQQPLLNQPPPHKQGHNRHKGKPPVPPQQRGRSNSLGFSIKGGQIKSPGSHHEQKPTAFQQYPPQSQGENTQMQQLSSSRGNLLDMATLNRALDQKKILE